MPWSQTPVVTGTLAITHPALLLSGIVKPSAFTSGCPEAILMTTNIDFSELNTEPASSIRPAQDSRYRAGPRTSLLTCRLDFGQVGIEQLRSHPLGNNDQFLSATEIPRSWVSLGARYDEPSVSFLSGRLRLPAVIPPLFDFIYPFFV